MTSEEYAISPGGEPVGGAGVWKQGKDNNVSAMRRRRSKRV
jgi:hypothetical protein